MFFNVVRQQVPQQVRPAQGHRRGGRGRQAGPDDLVQQLAADLGHYGRFVAAEEGRQIGLYHLLEGRGVRRAAELFSLPGCLQIINVADRITQHAEPTMAEVKSACYSGSPLPGDAPAEMFLSVLLSSSVTAVLRLPFAERQYAPEKAVGRRHTTAVVELLLSFGVEDAADVQFPLDLLVVLSCRADSICQPLILTGSPGETLFFISVWFQVFLQTASLNNEFFYKPKNDLL